MRTSYYEETDTRTPTSADHIGNAWFERVNKANKPDNDEAVAERLDNIDILLALRVGVLWKLILVNDAACKKQDALSITSPLLLYPDEPIQNRRGNLDGFMASWIEDELAS